MTQTAAVGPFNRHNSIGACISASRMLVDFLYAKAGYSYIQQITKIVFTIII